jgi:hypothetical protein
MLDCSYDSEKQKIRSIVTKIKKAKRLIDPITNKRYSMRFICRTLAKFYKMSEEGIRNYSKKPKLKV